ncbi:hypothetical protein GCM10026988_39330 [Vibrio panuliri]
MERSEDYKRMQGGGVGAKINEGVLLGEILTTGLVAIKSSMFIEVVITIGLNAER